MPTKKTKTLKAQKKTSPSPEASPSPAIALTSLLDIAHATQLYSELESHLKDGATLALDAANVEKITTPCVQILLAAGRICPLSVQNIPPAMESAFADLGMTSQLNEWK